MNLAEVAPVSIREVVMRAGRLLDIHWLSEAKDYLAGIRQPYSTPEEMSPQEKQVVRKWEQWVRQISAGPTERGRVTRAATTRGSWG